MIAALLALVFIQIAVGSFAVLWCLMGNPE